MHTPPMERIPALLCRAALSPVADKGTGTTAMAAPQPPAHPASARVRSQSALVLVSTESTACEYSEHTHPVGHRAGVGPRASVREFLDVHIRALMRYGRGS